MINYGVIVHGGAGSPGHFSDGCKVACESAFRLIEAGKSALDAVVEAVRILEDDGRFNAGYGSALRLDGKTVEMDASVMDSKGKIGIIIAIRKVKNPIQVARAVLGTPHVALAGEGATTFARNQGFAKFYKVSDYALERYKEIKQKIKEGKLSEKDHRWKNYDVEKLWNYKSDSYKDILCDTVGSVAIDKKGMLATANSTGGFSPMMLGRVGDSPMIGCGFYSGPACAVATTGMGEEIIKKMLAKTVYDMVANGKNIKKACELGIKMFSSEIKVGIIAISKEGYASMSNTGMANYALTHFL